MKKWNARLSRALALPPDALAPSPRIILSGNGEATVGGNVLLREYTPERVLLARRGLSVRIEGQALCILAMDEVGISVGGDIETISFLK